MPNPNAPGAKATSRDARSRPGGLPARRRGGRLGLVARIGVALLGLGGGLGLMTAGTVYVSYAAELATPEWRDRLRSFDDMVAVGITRFEAADRSLVGETFSERRLAVPWEEIPRNLILAVLAVEDARYFEHDGIDIRGIARAMVINLTSGTLKEGASTITQQLAKTLVGSKQTLSRKVLEAILARRMEDRYTKDQILAWYLNVSYLGHGSYGVKAAAQNYFRKGLGDLSLAELATIAGSLQSPSRVNAWINLPASRTRTAHVLDKMVDRGWVTATEAEAAKVAPLTVYPLRSPLFDQAPHYTEAVRRRGEYYFGEAWLTEGLTITLGLDPGTQRKGEEALAAGLEDVQRHQGQAGPLGRLDEATFFSRNGTFADERLRATPDGSEPVGARVLARVMEVDRDSVKIAMSSKHLGTLSLADHKWAGRRTEQPIGPDGKRLNKSKVSFDYKLKSMDEAFTVGDVILVEILAPPPPPAPKKAKPPKKNNRKRKPSATDEAAPEPSPVLAKKGDGPATHLARLVPIAVVEGALLSLHPDGRTVDTLVGGYDYDRSEVNRAFALRQLGSLMKPFIYGFAYELGLPPSALLSGAPFREGRYNPTGQRAKEDMFAWDGLVASENSVSLRVHRFGQDRSELQAYQAFGKALGLSRPLEGHTSEVLGMDQLIWDAFKAYATLAHAGRAMGPDLILKATDRDGRVVRRAIHPLQVHATAHDTLIAVHDRASSPPLRMIRHSTAYLVARNLTEVVRAGTATAARKIGFPVAGKTGTLPYDVWFAGFSDRRVALTWIGEDRRTRTIGPSEADNRIYGSTGPLPAWVDFMKAVDTLPKGVERSSPAGPKPDDVDELSIDPETSLLANPDTPGARLLPHRRGTGPTTFAPRREDLNDVGNLETEF